MLKYALAFFVSAIVAGIFSFSGLAQGKEDLAQIAFWASIALLLITLVLHVIRDIQK